MRSVLNLSLPKEKKLLIQKRAASAGKSVSAYVLQAIQIEQDLISEEELLQMASAARADHAQGKTKKLKSLADLMA
jgi:uncharacterized protein (DUF1778 family)